MYVTPREPPGYFRRNALGSDDRRVISMQTGVSKQKPNALSNVGRWDYVGMGILLMLLAVSSFGPSLVNPVRRIAPITFAVSAHGLLFSAWLFLFVAQAFLIATERRALHRRLGLAAIGIATLMVLSGYQTVIELMKRGFDLSGDLHLSDVLLNAVFPLGDLLAFTVLFCLGLWYRNDPAAHRRLMLLTTIGMMMPATVAHFIGHNAPEVPALVPLSLAILFITPAVYDRVRFHRFHPITLWGGILLILWGNVRAVLIGPSTTWKQFAKWLMS